MFRLGESIPRAIDLAPFRADSSEADALPMDLAGLARRDRDVRDSKRAYVVDVARKVGLEERQVAAALG